MFGSLTCQSKSFSLTPLHDWKLADSYFLVFNALAFNLCWIYDIIYLPD
jgi:predicted phosphoadenosine phosphosulfate sulfurtransferase